MINSSDPYFFENEQEFLKFKSITQDLRCVVCQNQNLWDSYAPTAIDLRLEIYHKMREGYDRETILQWVTERYGEAVLYNPGFQNATTILWLVPLICLIVGITILIQKWRSLRWG